MNVDITVRGSFTAFRAPERGTVRMTIGLEGPRADEVSAGVARQARTVSDSVRALHDPEAGPVTWWSSSQLRTWASRPWNKDGKRLPLVHHAAVDLRAKFADFGVLGQWLGRTMDLAGVAVDGIDWTLTEHHRAELVADVRTKAVLDARVRAEAYAAALGLSGVRAVAIADAGMLGDGLEPRGGGESAMFARAAGGHGQVDFQPEDVSVQVHVDARFVAEGVSA